MHVKFKGSETKHPCTEPIEQKVLVSGKPVGWAIMFHLQETLASSEMDELLSPEAISELTFIFDDEQKTALKIEGYSTVTACIIRHKSQSPTTELQFTKTDTKGDVTNG